MTAWDWFWLFFIFIPLTIIWFLVLTDAVKQPDLVGWQKGLWVALIIFFPWLGALAYLVTKPANPMAQSPRDSGLSRLTARYSIAWESRSLW
jgi:hypothetical protein